LDEQEILEVTKLSRAPRLEDARQQIPGATPDGNRDRWDPK
jgi:hypothetical protein